MLHICAEGLKSQGLSFYWLSEWLCYQSCALQNNSNLPNACFAVPHGVWVTNITHTPGRHINLSNTQLVTWCNNKTTQLDCTCTLTLLATVACLYDLHFDCDCVCVYKYNKMSCQHSITHFVWLNGRQPLRLSVRPADGFSCLCMTNTMAYGPDTSLMCVCVCVNSG